MSDQERRIDKRIACAETWIDITKFPHLVDCDNKDHRQKVKVENRSDGGICLISATPFDLNEVIMIHEQEGSVQGTVVWTCQSRLECKAGIQFESK